MKKKVLALGLNPSWQKSLFFGHLVFHEVNRAERVHAMPSGKGINFVRAARTWGRISATVLQPIGGDTGDQIREALLTEQLPEVSVKTGIPTRTCSTLICEKTKNITELIEPSGRLPEEDVTALESIGKKQLAESDALAVCGTFPPGITAEFYADFIRTARQNGKPVILDAYKEIRPSLEAGTDYLKINRAELSALTDCPDVEKAMDLLLYEYSLKALAVTAGPDTAFLMDPSGFFRYSIPALETFINPIGAGDTCTAVMFSELLSGTSCREAFAWGLAAASASCETAEAAVFSEQEAKRLFSSITIKKIS